MNELSSEMWKEYKKKQYWRIWSVAFQVDRLGGTGENLRQNQDETSRVSQINWTYRGPCAWTKNRGQIDPSSRWVTSRLSFYYRGMNEKRLSKTLKTSEYSSPDKDFNPVPYDYKYRVLFLKNLLGVKTKSNSENSSESKSHCWLFNLVSPEIRIGCVPNIKPENWLSKIHITLRCWVTSSKYQGGIWSHVSRSGLRLRLWPLRIL